jgi:hypothetical protein
MRARVVLVISVWSSMLIGAVRLFGDGAAPAAVGAGLVVSSLSLAARFVRRRLQPGHRSDERPFPAGPRRVLLVETGLAGPE